MDAFELLKKDHRKVSELFEQIETASGGASKKKIFSQLKSELDVHARVEEEIFYPALQNKEESRDITLEAYEEHKVVKDLLTELAAQAHSDEWDAKFTVLKENVEHHVEEEEGELFDKAEKVLSDEQIERLGAEMEAEKASQQRGTGATKNAANARQPAKAAPPAKKQGGGVLEKLADFIGLGNQPANPARRTATKKSGAKKSSKAATATKTRKASPARKTVKKSPAKASTKKGAKKAVKGPRSRKATKKTTKKAAKKK